ncbi:hypothetical protein [Methylophilus sp. 14]|jgi:acid phosphatase class B|uniref:hypothetical protein n=1 Tax=Methylophilus sp. 14 TaxID=2781019 RepID=UPI00188E8A7E|nr:hypothetical protein [Methylophilus sp. 14]MBF4986968.1 hypothetical protein [Methylophilus sp. 14]
MQKIFYFLHALCLMFALQTTAAEPAVTTTLLETGISATSLSNAIDDSLSADFGEGYCCVDMLEIAEVDVDKILLPGFSYPLHKTTHLAPEHQLSTYHLLLSFWLDRPPQRA